MNKIDKKYTRTVQEILILQRCLLSTRDRNLAPLNSSRFAYPPNSFNLISIDRTHLHIFSEIKSPHL